METENNKSKFTRMVKKANKAVFTELVCSKSSSGFCNTFNRFGSDSLKELFNGYTDFSLIKSHQVLNKGANGEVTKIVYEKDDFKTVAILKKSLNDEADNLFYEYAVGKYFINRIKNCFPCFCETYALYSDNVKLDEPEQEEKRINKITTDLLKETCFDPEKFSVLSEFVNSEGSLYDLIYKNKSMLEKTMYCVFQVYFALAVLRKNFTHYDLHSNNVIVYVPNPGHYIQYHYVFNDKTISFKSQYCVKIIDYGRCFFDNNILFGYKTNASIQEERKDEIYMSNTFPKFSDPKDFESSKNLHEKLRTIKNGCFKNILGDYGEDIRGYGFYFKELRNRNDVAETFHINFSKKNESHDVKLFDYIYKINKVYNNNGTIEDTNSGIKPVLKETKFKNVYDVCQFLASTIENEKAENETMYSDPTKEIGELTVYSDGREMVFSMTNPVVRPNLKPLRKKDSQKITPPLLKSAHVGAGFTTRSKYEKRSKSINGTQKKGGSKFKSNSKSKKRFHR